MHQPAPTTPVSVPGRNAAGHTADGVAETLSRRVERLRDDGEAGAQAVEYAMIGGLGAGLIGLLWSIISRTGLLDRVVETLLSALVELVTSWF